MGFLPQGHKGEKEIDISQIGRALAEDLIEVIPPPASPAEEASR